MAARFILSLSVLFQTITGNCIKWETIDLPVEHLPYFFWNNPDLKQECQMDDECPYKEHLRESRCWGYEDTCSRAERMSMPRCTHGTYSRGKLISGLDSETFWKQTDFGYVKERMENLKTYCKPQLEGDSFLQCVDGLKFCRGTNIYVDLRQAGIQHSMDGYKQDVLKSGQIGGHCQLDKTGLIGQYGGQNQALSSWFPEIQHFTAMTSRPILNGECDVIIDDPTFIIKPDLGINLYHHFCDFVNLYVSQHVNNFSTDVGILLWHTAKTDYVDLFQETWKVFSDHALLMLEHYDGKRVCFRDVVFSFLARMPMGLYYSLQPVENCYGSGLMRAFSQHTLHRLGIEQEGPLENKLRVTFLSRSTKYRKILNEEKILSTLQSNKKLDVKMVDFGRNISFLEQLKISHNTDVLLGIHGAGLTHLLFLPDWAVVFEIYNCEDRLCYLNLARIRGVKYITWENPDLMEPVQVVRHTVQAQAVLSIAAESSAKYIPLTLLWLIVRPWISHKFLNLLLMISADKREMYGLNGHPCLTPLELE